MLNLSLFSKPLVSACRSYIVIHCESPSICRRAPGECTGVCQAVKKLQLRLRRFVRPSYSNEMLICGLLREFIRAHNIYGTLCIARSAARNLYKLRNPPSTFLTCGRVRFPLSSPCVEIHCAGRAPPHPASPALLSRCAPLFAVSSVARSQWSSSRLAPSSWKRPLNANRSANSTAISRGQAGSEVSMRDSGEGTPIHFSQRRWHVANAKRSHLRSPRCPRRRSLIRAREHGWWNARRADATSAWTDVHTCDA